MFYNRDLYLMNVERMYRFFDINLFFNLVEFIIFEWKKG